MDEITSRPGWHPGQALAFVMSGGKGTRTAFAYEGSMQDPLNAAPELTVSIGGHEMHRVALDTDDMEEYVGVGTMDEGSSDLEICVEEFPTPGLYRPQIVGIRFQEVAIPPRALILEAYIQFACDEPEINFEPFNITITGLNDANPETFTHDPGNVSSRPRTQAQVLWSDIPAWTVTKEAGPNQRTPNLRKLVQEIVDRPDWQPGNALGFIFTGTGSRSAISFEGGKINGLLLVPTLSITYVLDE